MNETLATDSGPSADGPPPAGGRMGAIAAKYGKTPAQIIVRWDVELGIVPVPRSTNPARMAQNLDVFDFTLTDDDMAQIATLEAGGSQFFDHKDPQMVRWLAPRRLEN